MADGFSDPTAAGAVYLDPTALVFIAPIVLPEADPVYRDDALFASASANWRPPPIPVPPVPVLNEAGELTLIVAGEAQPVPPSAAILRDQAVAALKAPPAHYQPPASRGGARSTYTQPPPPAQRPSRRPPPARPPGSVTTSPATWLPSSGPGPTTPWRGQPPAPTWLPTSGGSPTAPGPGGRRPVPYPAAGGGPRPAGGRARSGKGWIPGLVILAFVVLANVVPHLGNVFHRGTPAAVDRTVNGYYSSVQHQNVATAASFVCDTARAGWTAGQSAASSDTKRDIIDHTITSTHADGGSNYTVQVSLEFGPTGTGSPVATLKVLKDSSGDYRVCGGTNP